jgi:ceramide glucosyltransferase
LSLSKISLLGLCVLPFFYYVLALYSTWRFFRSARVAIQPTTFPPLSNLKPVRGLDQDAYENFASFCRQDYPSDYELLFCVSDTDDPAYAVIEQLQRDFPGRNIRILCGSDSTAANDKCAKLARLVREARYETVVINDSDVRVRPDYFRQCVTPLADDYVGGVTCLYGSVEDATFADKLQTVGMNSDFFPGIFVARELDGVKFALGTTIATTRSCLNAFGGYEALVDRPGDDLLVGRLIAEQGKKIELLPYVVETVPDFASLPALYVKRLRWMTVMRHMRPWGHAGLIFTQGLPFSLLAILLVPSFATAGGFLSAYLLLRLSTAWMVSGVGMKRRHTWRYAWLVPVWDALAAILWLHSFVRNTIRWRNQEYRITNGALVPVPPPG